VLYSLGSCQGGVDVAVTRAAEIYGVVDLSWRMNIFLLRLFCGASCQNKVVACEVCRCPLAEHTRSFPAPSSILVACIVWQRSCPVEQYSRGYLAPAFLLPGIEALSGGGY